jgi:dUTP pyrophosphatase
MDLTHILGNNSTVFGNISRQVIQNDLVYLSRRIKKCGVLKLYVNSHDPELIELYRQHVADHNRMMQFANFPNSGFDLFIPQSTTFNTPNANKLINLGIKTEMFYCDIDSRQLTSSAFLVHPRSSISKTQLMLSNHTGIIDSGYRGFLMGAFRWLPDPSDNLYDYTVERHTRLLQICLPTLEPILVYLVENEDELSTTERGVGGFGSTGIVGTHT